MIEIKKIKIKFSDSKVKSIEAHINKNTLSLLDNGVVISKAEGIDIYDAYIKTREKNKGKFTLLCNGSRINATPSGMSRSMGGGRIVYLIEVGKQAKRDNLVDIFDYCEPNKIGTIDEQKEFKNKWIQSLKNL